MKFNQFIKHAADQVAVLLWPEVCPFCLTPCRDGICPSCRRKLAELEVQNPVCLCCGRPIEDEQQEYCRDCRQAKERAVSQAGSGRLAHVLPDPSPRVFNRGASLWLHREPVSTSLYQFKYHNQRAFAPVYAKAIVARYEPLIKSWRAQCLIPVPLHPRRQRQRGYNQAELLARELGKLLQLPVAAHAVERVKYTQPQKVLNGPGRRKNLHQAFRANPPVHPVKRVIVVDDIYTTGSTVEEVGRALKEVGVEKVYFLTVSTSYAIN